MLNLRRRLPAHRPHRLADVRHVEHVVAVAEAGRRRRSRGSRARAPARACRPACAPRIWSHWLTTRWPSTIVQFSGVDQPWPVRPAIDFTKNSRIVLAPLDAAPGRIDVDRVLGEEVGELRPRLRRPRRSRRAWRRSARRSRGLRARSGWASRILLRQSSPGPKKVRHSDRRQAAARRARSAGRLGRALLEAPRQHDRSRPKVPAQVRLAGGLGAAREQDLRLDLQRRAAVVALRRSPPRSTFSQARRLAEGAAGRGGRRGRCGRLARTAARRLAATYATLHLWTQIVGKIRLAQSPVDQPLLARDALRDGARPHDVADPARRRAAFQIDFDFVDHQLRDRIERRPGGARFRSSRSRSRRSTGA